MAYVKRCIKYKVYDLHMQIIYFLYTLSKKQGDNVFISTKVEIFFYAKCKLETCPVNFQCKVISRPKTIN